MMIPKPPLVYTASDSSVEEGLGDDDDCNSASSLYHKRQRSRRSKILRQKRSMTNEDCDMTLYSQTDEEVSPQGRGHGQIVRGTLRLPLSAGGSGVQLRHIASETTLFVGSSHGGVIRRQSDSSDFSDYRIASPTPDSIPSSPDFSGRSPRQSADSDMLELRECGPSSCFSRNNIFVHVLVSFLQNLR